MVRHRTSPFAQSPAKQVAPVERAGTEKRNGMLRDRGPAPALDHSQKAAGAASHAAEGKFRASLA